MKIYFAGSIRGGREDKELYLKIVQHLQNHGPVLTEHVSDQSLTELGETLHSKNHVYDRDMAWLKQANIVVAEVTQPSLGVGYELAKAEEMHMPILCLYRPQPGKRLSAMLTGNKKVKIVEYEKPEQAFVLIDEFFSSLTRQG